MARGPEARLQTKIQKAIKQEFPNSFVFKTHGGPFQMKGVPDLILCIYGFFIAIEVKVPGREDTLTAIQKNAIERINKSGGYAFMSTSVEDSLEKIADFLLKKLKN